MIDIVALLPCLCPHLNTTTVRQLSRIIFALLAMAAPPAPSGCLPKRLAAMRCAAMRGLDMRLRIGEGDGSGVSRCDGLGDGRFGRQGGPG